MLFLLVTIVFIDVASLLLSLFFALLLFRVVVFAMTAIFAIVSCCFVCYDCHVCTFW